MTKSYFPQPTSPLGMSITRGNKDLIKNHVRHKGFTVETSQKGYNLMKKKGKQ